MQSNEAFLQVKCASKRLALLNDAERNGILCELADLTEAHMGDLLAANALDLARMDKADPRYDRLQLTEARLRDIAADLRKVASLPSPLGRVLKHSTLPNGLELKRVSVPFGVIGIIFEARPNVCFDCFALCLKAGSACILKGGSDAKDSCTAIVGLIHEVLQHYGLPAECALLLTSHEDTDRLLQARGQVDLIIPRGSNRLINYVRDNARVPVIETGAGVVHCYIDRAADLQKAIPIVVNAKTRRVSVCNALDCLIIHRDRLADLPAILEPLKEKGVEILQPLARPTSGRFDPSKNSPHGGEDPLSSDKVTVATSGYEALPPTGGDGEGLYGTEFLSLRMAVKVVDSLDEALEHIARYGSGHSESIVTEDPEAAQRFLNEVDAACVYHNAPTSFTDGGQFGLGAEIGISTQKLHARGPMALEEITTYKWIIRGNGQTRA
ncbi:MAG: glutamate-5-semialdehyde dehydrogenase [Bacteroidaceae bacterium]|nr:glutamate-5-semialdehyde dehydrogenase [Bacteroidaceae bacterium]